MVSSKNRHVSDQSSVDKLCTYKATCHARGQPFLSPCCTSLHHANDSILLSCISPRYSASIDEKIRSPTADASRYCSIVHKHSALRRQCDISPSVRAPPTSFQGESETISSPTFCKGPITCYFRLTLHRHTVCLDVMSSDQLFVTSIRVQLTPLRVDLEADIAINQTVKDIQINRYQKFTSLADCSNPFQNVQDPFRARPHPLHDRRHSLVPHRSYTFFRLIIRYPTIP